ncbi:MAG TPA: DUF2798 domain-containing protein [Lysobacter sp.]
MLTPRQAQLAFTPLMVTAMSGIISFAMTLLNHGAAPGLLRVWLQQWPVAFAVALPAALVIVPSVRALLARLTRADVSDRARRLGSMG